MDQPFLIELYCEKRRSSISEKDRVVLLVDGLIVMVLQVLQIFQYQFHQYSVFLHIHKCAADHKFSGQLKNRNMSYP